MPSITEPSTIDRSGVAKAILESLMTRHLAFFSLTLLALCSCAPSATWHCTTQQVNEENDLVRLTIQIERQGTTKAESKTIASPTILFRRGEAASMRLESDAYTIHIEVPEDTGTADLRVTVNGKPIPVAQTGLELPQDPANQDSGKTG
jgi:hypothetical protein